MESLGPASIAELHSNLAKAFRRKNCLFRPCRSSVCVFFAVHLPIISKQSMISTTAYMTELSHLNKCNFWAPHSFSRQTKRAQRCGGCRDAEAQTPDPDRQSFPSIAAACSFGECEELCRYEYRFVNVLAAAAASMGQSQIFVPCFFIGLPC